MNRNTHTSTALAAVAFAVLMIVSLPAMGVLGAVAADDADDEYVGHPIEYVDGGYAVVQDDTCYAIEPLGDGHRTVEEYYDYRNPNTTPSSYSYSSHGTTHLQEDDTSLIFLHEGSDGLSLVFVHDRMDGYTDGGAATMLFTGLPEDGEWVVEDDNYEGADSEWDHRETSSRITSVWMEGRTDGGAFNELGDDFSIEVTPAFNDLADFRVFDGEVTSWQALSGDDHDPERIELVMHESIEIRPGGCSTVTDLRVDETANVSDEVRIEATIENAGVNDERLAVPIAVNDEIVHTEEVTVSANATTTISTTASFDDAGNQTVSVGELTATVEVDDGDEDDVADRVPGFGILVALMALALALLVARRRN